MIIIARSSHIFFFVYDCSDILIQKLTILAPIDSPNTDGINPGLVCLPLELTAMIII
jgi:polygalacturonase